MRPLPILLVSTLVACGGQPLPTPAQQAESAATSPQEAAQLGLHAEGSPKRIPDGPNATVSNGPQIAFDHLQHDFGVVSDMQALQCEFEFKNAGSATLEVTQMKASCGCTVPELSKTVFEPGESDRISVDWTPKGFGRQTQTVQVRSNSTRSNYLVLTVIAEIQPRVKLEPNRLALGNIDYGITHEHRVVARSDEPTMRILEVNSINRNVIANLIPAQPSDGADAIGVLDVRILPTAAKGALSGSIKIKIQGPQPGTGKILTYDLNMGVNATIFGKLQPSPASFYVGRVDPGGNVRYVVRLTHVDGSAFRVLTSEVLNASVPGLRCDALPFEDASGKGVSLVLYGSVGSFTGLLRGAVKLTTDVAEDGELTMPIMGIVRAANAKDLRAAAAGR